MSNYSIRLNINEPELKFPSVSSGHIGCQLINSRSCQFNRECSPTDGVITIVTKSEIHIFANLSHTRMCKHISSSQGCVSGNGGKGTCLVQESVFRIESMNSRFRAIRTEPRTTIVIHCETELATQIGYICSGETKFKNLVVCRDSFRETYPIFAHSNTGCRAILKTHGIESPIGINCVSSTVIILINKGLGILTPSRIKISGILHHVYQSICTKFRISGRKDFEHRPCAGFA